MSAIKVDGKRAYARVRAGEDVDLAAAAGDRVRGSTSSTCGDVRETDGTRDGVLDVDVDGWTCSSGTYVRALARDLGAALGCGGHLTALRRTRVGPYGLDAARTLEQLEVRHAAERAARVLGMARAAARSLPGRAAQRAGGPPARPRRAAAGRSGWARVRSPRSARTVS